MMMMLMTSEHQMITHKMIPMMSSLSLSCGIPKHCRLISVSVRSYRSYIQVRLHSMLIASCSRHFSLFWLCLPMMFCTKLRSFNTTVFICMNFTHTDTSHSIRVNLFSYTVRFCGVGFSTSLSFTSNDKVFWSVFRRFWNSAFHHFQCTQFDETHM